MTAMAGVMLLCLFCIIIVPPVFAESTGCQAEFVGKCLCKPNTNGDHVTNCTNAEFDSVSMLKETPVQTQSLIFVGNRINRIPPHVLGTHNNYTHLRHINLSNNNIRRILGNAFEGTTTHVRYLDLSGNMWELDMESNIFTSFPKLKELHLTGAFGLDQNGEFVLRMLKRYFHKAQDQLRNLEILHLENNRFQTLHDDGFFCFLNNLKEVYLGNNEITTLHLTPRCFMQLESLELLDLRENKLSYINNKTMDALDSLIGVDRQVNFMGNPFICNCTLNDMLEWITSTNVVLTNMDEYSCIETNSIGKPIHRLLIDLEETTLPCVHEPSKILAPPQPSRAGYIVFGVILLLLVAVSAGLVLINRSAAQRCFRYTRSPLQQKFEYSTIGSKSEATEVDV